MRPSKKREEPAAIDNLSGEPFLDILKHPLSLEINLSLLETCRKQEKPSEDHFPTALTHILPKVRVYPAPTADKRKHLQQQKTPYSKKGCPILGRLVKPAPSSCTARRTPWTLLSS